jgi:hypothetical protein
MVWMMLSHFFLSHYHDECEQQTQAFLLKELNDDSLFQSILTVNIISSHLSY